MERHVRCALLALVTLALLACATPPPLQTRVVYSDDGISELHVPDSWSSRANFGRSAALRVADGGRDGYLMVNTYLPHEIERTSLAQFAERVSASLRDNMDNGRMSGPRQLSINGRPALEYEVSGYFGETQIIYSSTVVEGRRAPFHHLIAWTPAESYPANRGAMRAVVASFRESAKPRAAKKRTDLVFNWPKQAKARIAFYSKENKRGESFETRGQGVVTVRARGNDLLLVSTQVNSHRMTSNAKDKDKTDYIEKLVKTAVTGVPDYVVTTDGDFVQVENLPAYQRRIEKALVKGLAGGPPEAREKAQQLVKGLLSEAVLAALIEEEWNGAVGNWAGGSFVPGETYRFAGLYQTPALGNRVFPMTITQQLTGRVPCQRGAKASGCVRLVQTSRVADPSFTDAMSRFVRQSVGNGIAVDKIEVVKTLVLVTDPETMLPYDVHATETKDIVVSGGGKSQASKEVQESRTAYTYSK